MTYRYDQWPATSGPLTVLRDVGGHCYVTGTGADPRPGCSTECEWTITFFLSSSHPSFSSFIPLKSETTSLRGIPAPFLGGILLSFSGLFLSLPLFFPSLLSTVSHSFSESGSMLPPSGGEPHGSRPERRERREADQKDREKSNRQHVLKMCLWCAGFCNFVWHLIYLSADMRESFIVDEMSQTAYLQLCGVVSISQNSCGFFMFAYMKVILCHMCITPKGFKKQKQRQFMCLLLWRGNTSSVSCGSWRQCRSFKMKDKRKTPPIESK